ncbi:Iron-sulfur cluster-binding protein [Polaromonas sp. CG9_12]|uniref:4Fe-4S binding protein n=1 Tax=Polaromonas sp. CG_9.5 TaxID=3071705 RepID=UPI0004DDCF3C|nr:4Fe-4S binding protein [Polaromonas sp. CG_9.5]MEC5213739.1 ferredoxin [Polaromonas sp. CG_9.5]CDS50852.1 Iron-sulfur cluster-binding protein [Polaromonas sp. CG9_12]
MPLQPLALGSALDENLTLHSTLCRREAGAFQKAVQSGDDVIVACTQETRLFAELAQQTEGATSVIKFVNIRETGGWSKDAGQASAKIAALLALAHLPDAEPVPTVTYKSAGRLLIIGPLDAAERAAELVSDALDVTLFSLGAGSKGGLQERRYPVLAGQIGQLTGWLGAFELNWTRSNPIDLDLCTRCNACLSACPEGAIGFDYQIDMNLCQSHRACVKVCGVAGAIDFSREPEALSEKFDLVLDLRATPAFTQHALPQGYFRWDGQDSRTLLQLRSLVGEFEKPKFFNYKQKLCAHSRNNTVGCSACIDVCSASAISSEKNRQQIKVNPNLCVGCGACTTVCPTGAISYAYPRPAEQGTKIKTLLTTYAKAGGKHAALLLHSQEAGTRLLGDLGRRARLDPAIRGVPARVMPLGLFHTASTGLELWLSSVAYGASQVWVLMTGEEAPQYREAVRAQMDVAQAILTGLGFSGEHFRLLEAKDARDLAALDVQLQAMPAQGVAQPAGFAVQADKRATLELALDHLMAQAPATMVTAVKLLKVEVIALPAASPLGALAINKDACTLCLSCVSACPASALQDNAERPQLRFIEKNCVQCGLCVTTCPENALALVPQLRLTAQRKESVVINEMQPYACIRCSKPFGTLKAIESMLGKLAGHAMFQGAAANRLKMCSDCRVIDIYSADNEVKISDIR